MTPRRLCLLLLAAVLVCNCGRKAPPTLASYQKPRPPSGLTALQREGQIIISWTYAADQKPPLKGFDILRSEDRDFRRIGFIEKDKRSFTDGEISPGTGYTYKVIARSLTDILSEDPTVLSVTARPSPSPPQNIRFVVKTDSIELSWQSSGDGLCYNLYRSGRKGTYAGLPVNREPLCTLSYEDHSLSPESPVFYTLRAVERGEVRAEGAASPEIEIKPSHFIPSPPSDLMIVRSDNRTSLTWKESPEPWVRGYRIYRRREGEASFAAIGEVAVPSFVDKEKFDKRVGYLIRAFGPSAESAPLEGEVEK